MRLKNVLLAVCDIDKSREFYRQVFGLQVTRDFGDNLILSEGLVLQERSAWEKHLGQDITVGNGAELFFEDYDLTAFLNKIETYKATHSEQNVQVGETGINSWGRQVVMLRDPDGHLIEVAQM